MVDRVGQQFGNYRLVRLLGRGGYGEVYLGEHIHLKTQAAIKVLTAELTSTEMMLFQEEARLIAHLEHDHIVPVLEFGFEDTIPFLVMKYAPNGTLRNRHPKGTRVPLAIVVSYVKHIADALQYAHDERLVHRDIKPENILVGQRDEILLSDFGIALAIQSSRDQRTQDVAGTAAYMSPEQIQGKPRPASDQYSLGIVVYEWLTGTLPFHGSANELYPQHLHAAPPPLREKVPGIPQDVEQVILKALSKDPRERFTNVLQFANALEIATQPTEVVSQATKVLANRGNPSPTSPYQSSQQVSTDVHALYARGQRVLAQRQRALAIQLFLQVLAVEPEYDSGNLVFLVIELLQMEIKEALRRGRQNEAVEIWRTLVRLDPPSSDIAKLSAIYEQCIDGGELSTAKELLRNLWDEAPDYRDLLHLAPKVGLQSYQMARASGLWNEGTACFHFF